MPHSIFAKAFLTCTTSMCPVIGSGDSGRVTKDPRDFVVGNFLGHQVDGNLAGDRAGVIGQHEILYGGMALAVLAGEQEAECRKIVRKVLLLDQREGKDFKAGLGGPHRGGLGELGGELRWVAVRAA